MWPEKASALSQSLKATAQAFSASDNAIFKWLLSGLNAEMSYLENESRRGIPAYSENQESP
jgi:hypothetical protein